MEYEVKELLKNVRPETRPLIPKKVWWKAKIFGQQVIKEYLWNYYKRESEYRVPFYLPSIFLKECMQYLCRVGKIPKDRLQAVLIDGEDFRIDYFLSRYLEQFQYVTIITDRQEYFKSLEERAFQELGLLVDFVHSWEEKQLTGNLVWDFSETIQKSDCYPEGSVCFLPYKREWKQNEIQNSVPNITIVKIQCVKANGMELSPGLAESMLVPSGITFRASRCEMLRKWCEKQKWRIKLKVCKAPKTLTF